MIRGLLSGPPGRLRPFVEVHIAIPSIGISGKVQMLVNTGADSTLFGPFDALYLGIDTTQLPQAMSSTGVGGRTPTVSAEAMLTLGTHTFPIMLRILAPQTRQQQQSLQSIPSLLGRDVLSHFALFLEERTNRVLLLDPNEADALNLPDD